MTRWKTVLGLTAGVLAAVAVARGMANCRRLELCEETVDIPDLPAPFDGFRLLHLTDLHLPRHSDLGDRLLALVDEVQPDLVCLGGDYVFTALSLDEVEFFLRQLAQRWPAVAIYGNADYRPDITAAHRAGWAEIVPFLYNAALPLSRGGERLWITGVGDPHRQRDDLPAALREVPADVPVILLAHSPDIITRPPDPRIRLILCGHTHGGQVCLPGGRALYSNTHVAARYASGRHTVHGAQLYISRGIGATRLPLRLNCLPEVTVFTLRRGKASGE